MTTPKIQIEEKLEKLIELTEALEARKALYDELDKVTLELREAGFHHAILHGKEITLRDNFSEKNVQWRMAAVRRFEAIVKDVKEAGAGKKKKEAI